MKRNLINKKALPMCWRCKKGIGTYFHMWWICEKIQKNWALVFKEINEIRGLNIQTCPRIVLLNMLGNTNIDGRGGDIITIMVNKTKNNIF